MNWRNHFLYLDASLSESIFIGLRRILHYLRRNYRYSGHFCFLSSLWQQVIQKPQWSTFEEEIAILSKSTLISIKCIKMFVSKHFSVLFKIYLNKLNLIYSLLICQFLKITCKKNYVIAVHFKLFNSAFLVILLIINSSSLSWLPDRKKEYFAKIVVSMEKWSLLYWHLVENVNCFFIEILLYLDYVTFPRKCSLLLLPIQF